MSKSYKEVINKIHVDDAMKQRILQNIEQEQRSSSKDNRGEKNIFHYFQYKKLSVCAAVVVLLLCCVFYFGTSIILQPDTANQHNLASANKKDSLSARADRKEADSDDVSSDAANAEDEFNTGEESDAGSEFMDMLPDMNQYSSATHPRTQQSAYRYLPSPHAALLYPFEQGFLHHQSHTHSHQHLPA